MIEKTITKTKIYEDEEYEIDIYKTITHWSDLAQQDIEMTVKIGTRTRTKKVWTGDYDITESTKYVAHTHPEPWYKDPATMIALGGLVVSIITLIVSQD